MLTAIYGLCTRHQELLRDQEWLAGYLGALCEAIGMTPVGAPIIEGFPHWTGGAPSGVQFIDEGVDTQAEQGGNTGVQVLAESAITIHTYPEDGWIELVIDSCNKIPRPDWVGQGLHDLFGLQVPYGGLINRPDWSVRDLQERPMMKDGWWDYLGKWQ